MSTRGGAAMLDTSCDTLVVLGPHTRKGHTCTSVFLPVALNAPFPAALTAGGGEPDPRSSWWAQKALGDAVMGDPARLVPAVERAWATWEPELEVEAARGRRTAARGRVVAMLERGRALRTEIEAG